jgi:regulator of protease activity HflC (stomatin/prohibitin superfamily)
VLDKLIDLIIQFVELFRFFVVIDHYQRAVVLRLGKYHRTLEPGLHWVIPMAEDALVDNIKVRTIHMGDQILTTTDGHSVIVAGIIRWTISDIRKALLEVDGLDDVYRDIVITTIAETVEGKTLEQLWGPAITEELTKKARKMGWRYGVEVESLTLGNKAQTISITLNKST